MISVTNLSLAVLLLMQISSSHCYNDYPFSLKNLQTDKGFCRFMSSVDGMVENIDPNGDLYGQMINKIFSSIEPSEESQQAWAMLAHPGKFGEIMNKFNEAVTTVAPQYGLQENGYSEWSQEKEFTDLVLKKLSDKQTKKPKVDENKLNELIKMIPYIPYSNDLLNRAVNNPDTLTNYVNMISGTSEERLNSCMAEMKKPTKQADPVFSEIAEMFSKLISA